MGNEKEINGGKPYAVISLAAMIAITAAYFRLEVLTAIPIGFLFGFFPMKGQGDLYRTWNSGIHLKLARIYFCGAQPRGFRLRQHEFFELCPK
jgi:hypothetical protein